ncbi:MAG: DUF6305 family protein [Candidatus Aerophobetes bacterium]|nr:DUF6305 family protein [Candidatus Aerophobetes bacterium]
MRLRTRTLGSLSLFLILIVICFFGLSRISYATEQVSIPTAELPLVVTPCGQSPGALMIDVLCKRIKLPCSRVDMLTAEDLKSKADQGKGYKTLIIITGTSLKGMGAAGVDIDVELSRIKAIIQEAKKENILIIGAHIEGMARRVDEMDAASIDTVIPESDVIIVRADSNEDGYFTKLSKEHSIPLLTAQETLDVSSLLKELFHIEEGGSAS